MVKVIYYIFNIYAFGLMIYIACSWIKHPKAITLRNWLNPLYSPVLQQIAKFVKPIHLGKTYFDISPIIFFAGLVIARKLVIFIFVLLAPY